jgi:hypothetical protein
MLGTHRAPQPEEYPYPLPKSALNGLVEREPWDEREPIMHEHVCADCEMVFGCEGQCDSGNESLCEECDIAAERANVGNGPVTAFCL